MANPYGIAEFSVPQLIGLDSQLKSQRLQQLYTNRQQAREDYTFERQQKNDAKTDATDDAYKAVFAPSSGGVAAATGAAPVAGAPTSILPENNQVPGAPVTSPTVAAPGTPAPAATSPAVDPLSFKPDPTKLRALAATGAQGYQAAAAIMKMNAEQVKAAQEQVTKGLELEGQIINGVRKLPPEQRNAEYQRQKAAMAQQGVDTSSFPPAWSEQAADGIITSSMKTAEALGLDAQAAAHAETTRHNHAEESTASGNLAVAQGGLKVRQDALDAAKKPGANTSTADLLRAAGLGN